MAEEIKTKEGKLSIYQILNDLQINGRTRRILHLRHSDKSLIKKDWLKIFKEDGFEF